MADQPVNSPPVLEQRIEKLEGSVSQILELLKALSNKDNAKDKVSDNDLNESHPPINEEDTAEVVIITPKGSHGKEKSGSDERVKDEEAKMMSKMEILEEKVRVMQGMDVYGNLDMQDFCLFPDMEIPAKFKVPDFEKFEGKTDPVMHLTMYSRSMAAYHKNEKLMIHCFQHSLAGGALTWFLHLDKNQVRSWRELAEMFVKQYQFVTDITPDRFELQRMKKVESETFREYAQRWREKASQVQPPLNEKEIVRLFVKTLDGAYFEKLLGCVTNRFADMVIAGEQVEDAIREGKLSGMSVHQDKFKKSGFQKKEGEVHVVNAGNYTPGPQTHQPFYQPPSYSVSPFHPYLYPNYLPNHPIHYHSGTSTLYPVNNVSSPGNPINTSSFTSQNQSNKFGRERVTIEPIPVTYNELYDTLLKENLVAPEVSRPVPNPIPKWYNANETCKYHMGEPGHSIERCITFKVRVQKLKNAGKLTFKEGNKQPGGPSTDTNPLFKH